MRLEVNFIDLGIDMAIIDQVIGHLNLWENFGKLTVSFGNFG